MIKGIPASKGIGIGKALIYKQDDNITEFVGKKVKDTETDKETARFKAATLSAGSRLDEAGIKAAKVLEEKELQLFEAYKQVLNDPILTDMVLSDIKKQQLCAEAAVLNAVDKIKAMFLALNNDYMRQRAEDVENVGNYILDDLLGREIIDLSQLEEDTILIAKELTPADTAALDKKHIKGFAMEKGGETSHTAIVARILEIPAVVGCGEKLMEMVSGEILILDGEEGIVLSNPAAEVQAEYEAKLHDFGARQEEIQKLKDKPAETLDGIRVELAGNIGKPDEASGVLDKGGDGIGLFRTEFLYLERTEIPTEEEQYQAYKTVAGIMGDKPCIVRTMDIGGDKQLSYLKLPKEENPFLG
ncbi:MAG: PtsA, partial [Eubacterium sp.]|nr:PtsA [Eubacterium sp.]